MKLQSVSLIGAIALSCSLLSACGSKTGNVAETAETVDSLTTDSADVKTVANANIDSVKHTKDYINQRIDTIYKYKNDGQYCSESYRALEAEAVKLSEERDEIYFDGDHWINGQDIDPKWSYKVKKIELEGDSVAWADITIHNFGDSRVKLRLLYERGDWFVDDFYFYYKDEGVIKELREKEGMKEYISANRKK